MFGKREVCQNKRRSFWMSECLEQEVATERLFRMINQILSSERQRQEAAVTEQFLDDPCELSFTALFKVFAPQLISFFRARSREASVAEDLTQEVMLTVYRKARQVRDRTLFRAWLFKVAQNALRRHYGRSTREVETVDLADVANRLEMASPHSLGTPTFEFRDWMAFLDARERDVMTLRFVEQWEYHEIAAARGTPIGTIQWRIFNSKKKLAGHLMPRHSAGERSRMSAARNEKRKAGSSKP